MRRTILLSLSSCLFLVAALQDDAKPASPLVAGDLHFEWDADWPTLTEGLALGNTHGGIVVDAKGTTYFNTDSEHAVIAIDAKGKMSGTVGEQLAGGAHGMCLAAEGDAQVLFVAHTRRHQVVKLDLEGRELATFDWPEASGKYDAAGQFNPTAVAIGPDGQVFVADGYGRSWIHEYAPDGTWKKCFGGPGSEPGQLRTPHGISLDTRGETPVLVVSDRENRRLQTFGLDGTFLEVVAKDLRRPCGVSIRGDHCAVAELEGRVTILGKDWKVVGHLGEQPDKGLWATNQVGREKWKVGEFLSPHGVCWDVDGDLYVMDWNREGRVTRLARRKSER
jgi:hypothetical protein